MKELVRGHMHCYRINFLGKIKRFFNKLFGRNKCLAGGSYLKHPIDYTIRMRKGIKWSEVKQEAGIVKLK